MTFTELELLSAYDSGDRQNDVLRNFYIPVLQEAINYKRLSGYFSSQVLALAARGIAGLISNGGTMKLITSPALSPADFEVLKNASNEVKLDLISDEFSKALDDVNNLSSVIAYDHLRALAWMLREGHLEIRVLIPRKIGLGVGIFHSKVGILEDNLGNKLSFSGSVNETAMGWTQNIEEFKVFRSWIPGNEGWISHDEHLFEKYWNCSDEDGFESIQLPKAVKQKLIELAPQKIEELDLEGLRSATNEKRKSPRSYQIDAINAWANSDFQGILEMATGTGKTFTARECLEHWKKGKSSSLTLIIAPTQTIGSQWREIMKDLDPITTFEAKPWRELVRDLGSKISSGLREHCVVISIQNTASSGDFIKAINKLIGLTDNHLIIADEMHGLGAPVFRKALNDGIEARLGLTATPNRWFDEPGTDLLNSYFKGVVFTFGIHEALNWIDPQTNLTPLCPYEYHPQFIDLDELEMDEYLELTKKIIIESRKDADSPKNERLEQLQFKRAAILKTAHGKFSALATLLTKISSISRCLVYCSDREQINEVINIVATRGIIYRTFTGEEGVTPKPEFGGMSERDWILRSFESGHIQMLIAMKCLDEGVDIPSARLGIILASTSNPREFIQRRGRLLRRSVGKEKAIIYDMVVAPIFSKASALEISNAAKKIMLKELNRIEEFASDSLNSEQISGMVLARMIEMGAGK